MTPSKAESRRRLREDGHRFRALVGAFLNRDKGFEQLVRQQGVVPTTLNDVRKIVDKSCGTPDN